MLNFGHIAMVDVSLFLLVTLIFWMIYRHEIYVGFGVVWIALLLGMIAFISFPLLIRGWMPFVISRDFVFAVLFMIFWVILLVLIYFSAKISKLLIFTREISQFMALRMLLKTVETKEDKDKQ